MKHITETEYLIIKNEELEKTVADLARRVKLLEGKNTFRSEGKYGNRRVRETKITSRYR